MVYWVYQVDYWGLAGEDNCAVNEHVARDLPDALAVELREVVSNQIENKHNKASSSGLKDGQWKGMKNSQLYVLIALKRLKMPWDDALLGNGYLIFHLNWIILELRKWLGIIEGARSYACYFPCWFDDSMESAERVKNPIVRSLIQINLELQEAREASKGMKKTKKRRQNSSFIRPNCEWTSWFAASNGIKEAQIWRYSYVFCALILMTAFLWFNLEIMCVMEMWFNGLVDSIEMPSQLCSHNVTVEPATRIAMILLSWNCPRPVSVLKSIVRLQNPHNLFLIETKLDTKGMEMIRIKLKYDGCIVVESQGCSSGLALLRKHSIQLQLVSMLQIILIVKLRRTILGNGI